MAYTTIDDPSEYFQTKLYTGTGSSLALTNDGNSDLQPDWIWIKSRNFSDSHHLTNTSVGLGTHLRTNTTAGDYTNAQVVTAVASDGFTVGTDAGVNTNTKLHVAWQWKANGGTTTTNDASSTSVGNNDSVIQANTEAGFSIVTFTSPGSGLTIAHGLGGKPDLIISKSLESTEKWSVHTTLLDGSLDYLRLSETDAAGNSSFSLPTSTVFGYNGSDDVDYVAYCFRSIQGYSKIGTYTGNGSADGPFIYTGFKPAWVLVKRFDTGSGFSGAWDIHDSTRGEGVNPTNESLIASATNVESDDQPLDFLSNGWKVRHDLQGANISGGSYLYYAIAESPFVSSKGVPTTAR